MLFFSIFNIQKTTSVEIEVTSIVVVSLSITVVQIDQNSWMLVFDSATSAEIVTTDALDLARGGRIYLSRLESCNYLAQAHLNTNVNVCTFPRAEQCINLL